MLEGVGDIPIAPLGDGAAKPHRRGRRPRVITGAIAAVVAVAALAAAVGITRTSPHDTARTVTVGDVAGATRGTVRFTMALDNGASGPSGIDMRADGTIDFDHHRSKITLSLGALPTHTGSAAARAALAPLQKQTELFSDGKIYIDAGSLRALLAKVPAGLAGLASGELAKLQSPKIKWIAIEVASSDFGGISFAEGIDPDPTHVFDLLKARGATAHFIGREQVGGIEASHYRARVTLADSFASSSNTFTLSTGTLSTGTLSTGTLSTGTLSTGTLSTGTLSTGTLSTGTLSTGTLSTGTLPTTVPAGHETVMIDLWTDSALAVSCS